MSSNIGKTLVNYWLNDVGSTAHNTGEADIGMVGLQTCCYHAGVKYCQKMVKY